MGYAKSAMTATQSILPLMLKDVSLRANGVNVLDSVSIDILGTRRLIVLGPNGAGKSILLRLCHGLIEPTSGRVEWARPKVASRKQAMVFQKPVLLRRSVRENIDHALRMRRYEGNARDARSKEAMQRFGLLKSADFPARLLSGGQQQRLAIARAWAVGPEIIFLDEPCSHLDPTATRSIESMIIDLQGDGMTTVMSTHDLGQARRLAEDIAFLHKGKLVESGPAENFFSNPQTPAAQAFLSGELFW